MIDIHTHIIPNIDNGARSIEETINLIKESKEAGFDGNFTYRMENISTSKRNLMNPDELLKLDNDKEIVIVRGRKPFICNKYDYSKHTEASNLQDMTIEEQKIWFKENLENEKNKRYTPKKKYSFKDF